MKVSLISDSESGVNIFPALREKLGEEVADLKFEEAFVPNHLDLPHKALELAENSDLLFVFSLYPKNDFSVEILLEKLVDLELQTGKKIIKAVEELDLEELKEAELDEELTALAEKWSTFILNYLYHPEKFIPETEKESDEEFVSYSEI